MLVGFHGYAEDAETQLERLRSIPGSSRWFVVSIQGLHRFYQRRFDRVVASWMTRQDRELAISDNMEYISGVIAAIEAEWPVLPNRVFAGFSQGVAMAFRAATAVGGGVIAVGGDVPPELTPAALSHLSAALIVHGTSDEWYTKDKFAADDQRLRASAVNVQAVEFNGGHEWSAGVTRAASELLHMLYPVR